MSQMILRTGMTGRPSVRLNGWPWLLPVLVLLLWFVAAQQRWMPEQILPAPSVVAETAWSLLSGDLLAQWGFSLQHAAWRAVWSGPGSRPANRAAVLCAGADPNAWVDPAVYGAVRYR